MSTVLTELPDHFIRPESLTIEEFNRHGWSFITKTTKLPMVDSEAEAVDALSELNAGEHLPEMLWVFNEVVLSCEKWGLKVKFSPLWVLEGARLRHQRCSPSTDPLHSLCACPLDAPVDTIQLRFASQWTSGSQLGGAERPEPTIDWTYTSGFKGHFEFETDKYRIEREIADESTQLPMEKLTDTSIPILHYSEVEFFEDDLADCGISKASVRLRVMPDFWYLAMSQMIRVDGSRLRTRHVRVYHEFGTETLLREVTFADQEHILSVIAGEEAPKSAHGLGKVVLRGRHLERLVVKNIF